MSKFDRFWMEYGGLILWMIVALVIEWALLWAHFK